MPGIDLLVIVFIVLVFGGVIFARISRALNQRRRAQPGDKDLLAAETSGERPVQLRVTNENQPRFQWRPPADRGGRPPWRAIARSPVQLRKKPLPAVGQASASTVDRAGAAAIATARLSSVRANFRTGAGRAVARSADEAEALDDDQGLVEPGAGGLE